MDKKIIEKILTVLNEFGSKLCTIATVSEDGAPHSASVYFVFNNDLNIYFATRASTRKYKDILKDPRVAFLASVEHTPKTVQIEGNAALVMDPEEQREYIAKIFAHANKQYPLPPIAQMMDAELILMKITPAWARLGDFDVLRETEIFEETTF